jgi:hypothetical protein
LIVGKDVFELPKVIALGLFEQDFVAWCHHNSVYALNAASPGWTRALPFGRWIAQQKFLPLL